MPLGAPFTTQASGPALELAGPGGGSQGFLSDLVAWSGCGAADWAGQFHEAAFDPTTGRAQVSLSNDATGKVVLNLTGSFVFVDGVPVPPFCAARWRCAATSLVSLAAYSLLGGAQPAAPYVGAVFVQGVGGSFAATLGALELRQLNAPFETQSDAQTILKAACAIGATTIGTVPDVQPTKLQFATSVAIGQGAAQIQFGTGGPSIPLVAPAGAWTSVDLQYMGQGLVNANGLLDVVVTSTLAFDLDCLISQSGTLSELV